VRQLQSGLDNIFRRLEAVDRFFSVTVLLKKASDLRGAHQFINQIPLP
jgi:hypothetical protein